MLKAFNFSSFSWIKS